MSVKSLDLGLVAPRDVDRFWSKVVRSDGCWQWTGTISVKGYGRFRLQGRMAAAHRLAYHLAIGPVPQGLQLDHLCRNRGCVRPDHLEAVTARVNLLRGQTKAAANARKTHCPAGHPYEGENLFVIAKRGIRKCRACHRVTAKASRDRKAS